MDEVPLATTVRAALAAALLAGFYLIGTALLAGLTGLSVWLWLAFPGQEAHDASYLVVALSVGLAVPTWRLLRARPEPPPDGVPVSEQQAAELWSQVRAFAESVGTRPPDEIRLTFEANAGVWEDARLLGLCPGRRYLYLGIPLLQACAVGPVRAVLAHELGHYSHRHTRLGGLTYRGMRVIVRTIVGVGPRSLAGRVLAAYAVLYAFVSLAVMRRMEMEADRAAVRAAGQAATVRALRDVPRLCSAWEAFLVSYVRWNRGKGYTPTELLAWFGWLVEYRPAELERAGHAPAPAGRWDSHPPIDERVAMIERDPEPSVEPDPRPGTVLVPDLDTMAAALRTTAFAGYLERLAQDEAELDADRLYHAAASIAGTCRRGLGGVLDALESGRRDELRRALALPVHPAELFLLAYTPSGKRRLSVDAFEAGLAAAALAELRLRTRIRLDGTGEATVVVCDATPTGDRFLDSVLTRVAAGRPRPAYRWLQTLGSDVSDAVARRLDLMDLYPWDRASHDTDRLRRVRTGIAHALDTGSLNSRDLVLGALLWGTELATPVLGWGAVGPRFWLGRLGKRDQLAVAVRTVMGLHTPLPAPGVGDG